MHAFRQSLITALLALCTVAATTRPGHLEADQESRSTSVPAAPEDGGPRNWEVVVSDALNLREQPSTSAPVVAAYAPGTILDNLGCREAGGRVWCDVQELGGGPRGYVAAEYLRPAVSPDGSVSTGPDDSALRAGQGEFDATGSLPCAQVPDQPMGQCEFGVARAGGGYATVVVTKPDGRTRAIFFRMGIPIGADTAEADHPGEFSAAREGDLNLIRLGSERYEIPDAVVLGPAGRVQAEEWSGDQRLTFYSDGLGEQRRLYVHLPTGYDASNRSYPVLYVLDAEFFFEQATAAVRFLSETRYIRDHPMPEMLVVGIVNRDRNRDFTPTHAPEQGPLRFPTSGGGERFTDFLVGEVFPLIDSRYRTHPYRVVAGWSLGGLYAVDTWLRHPETFSAYLAISPSLWWDGDREVDLLESEERAGERPVERLVVTLGADEGGDMDRTVRNGIRPLLDATPTFEYLEVSGEGHAYVFHKAILDGLRAVYRSWTMPASVSEGGMAAVTAFYEALSDEYGYPVRIPEGAFRQVRLALVRIGEPGQALAVARRASTEYPASSTASAGLGWTLLQVGDSASARASYERAVQLEEAMPEPDSELLLSFRQQLADLGP